MLIITVGFVFLSKRYFGQGCLQCKEMKVWMQFFDDYVTSKTSLKQFVEQYDNALKSKVEKENKVDYFFPTRPTSRLLIYTLRSNFMRATLTIY